MRTYLALGCTTLAMLVLSCGQGQARPMHVMSSTPAAQAIMHGRNEGYVVRFDGPVDHAHSRLEILRDGQVISVLRPRLNSAPDFLFASAPALAPGQYVLHWVVRSAPDQDESDGMIAFSVAP